MVVSKIVVFLQQVHKERKHTNQLKLHVGRVNTDTKIMTQQIKFIRGSFFSGIPTLVAGIITCHPIIIALGIMLLVWGVVLILNEK